MFSQIVIGDVDDETWVFLFLPLGGKHLYNDEKEKSSVKTCFSEQAINVPA